MHKSEKESEEKYIKFFDKDENTRKKEKTKKIIVALYKKQKAA